MLCSAISDGLHASLERDLDLDPTAWLKSYVSDDFLQVDCHDCNNDVVVSGSYDCVYITLFILTTVLLPQAKIKFGDPALLMEDGACDPPPVLPPPLIPCHAYIIVPFVCASHPAMLPYSCHEMSIVDWRAHGLRQPDPTFHPLAIPRECGTTIGRFYIIAQLQHFLNIRCKHNA